MKVLATNLAKTATLSALYETLTYPPSNTVDRFLELPFISTLDSDTFTVDMGSNKSIDCVFISGCNAATVNLVIKNAALATLYSDTETIDADTIVVYPGTLSARYIEITGTAVGSSYFRINGVATGVISDLGSRSYQSESPVVNRTTMTTSATGQVMANSAPTLKVRDVSIPIIRKDNGYTRVQTIESVLDSIGIGNHVYWDLNDDLSDFEAPLYGVIQREWRRSFDKNNYTIEISILEAR